MGVRSVCSNTLSSYFHKACFAQVTPGIFLTRRNFHHPDQQYRIAMSDPATGIGSDWSGCEELPRLLGQLRLFPRECKPFLCPKGRWLVTGVRMDGIRCSLSRNTLTVILQRRLPWVQILFCILLTACGGGGSSGEVVGPTGTPVPEGYGIVAVTVTDVFGEPVTGASVSLYDFSEQTPENSDISHNDVTDADGRAEFIDLPAGIVDVSAVLESGIRLEAFAEVNLAAGSQIDLQLTVLPVSNFSAVFSKAIVEPDGVQDNGRVLEFTLRFFWIPNDASGSEVEYLMYDCTPDTTNDSSDSPADCIEDISGFDAPYQVANQGMPLTRSLTPRGPVQPYAATILIDQGGHVLSIDPFDARLYGAKYLLETKLAESRIALAAFSASDSPSGEFSALPQEPVTFFPESAPQFYTSGSDLYPIIDSLSNYEGGVSPLYAAIDQVLDFTDSKTTPDERRAVIVYTDGTDDTCGLVEACRTARQSVVDKSLASGVQVLAIGQLTDSGDVSVLRSLPEQGGLTAWVLVEGQLAAVFAQIAPILDGSASLTELRFRIESTTDGVFQSGRTVLANLELCAYGCWGLGIPIAIQIP